MSKYTTQVRFICEEAVGLTESEGYGSIEKIIEGARGKIFDFDYPIFDEEYKGNLERKILRHYYTREIGLETVGLWKHFLNMKMNEIMPYYNQLYKSALLEFDPFNDADYTRDGTRNTVQDKTENSTGVSTMGGTVTDEGKNEPKRDTWTLYSDTPQGGVAGIEAAEASVGSNAYLTNATHVIESGEGSTDENVRTYDTENNTTAESKGKMNEDGKYFEKIKGKISNKSYSELLMELRKTFLNIDMLIINELGDLFMNIY